MKLYNTLTRQIEVLEPLSPPQITVYTCGPTVYDYAHIGHWFTYVRMDTLIRTLQATGFDTKWVMNITDVGHLVSDADEGEDKLEKGARREGKTAWEVADFYAKDFLTSMQLLKILQPDHIVKATDHIAEQIALIEKLEQKGYTYIIDDGVYYDISKFEGYEAFARLDLSEQVSQGRVVQNDQKRNQADFALWKFSPANKTRDMEWDSPWGKGFPGWHIECSAMSMKYLGDTLDIHTGGIDHVPVHHTNEIAQSEAVTGKRFANYWMHSNHVMIQGEKISKSLENGIHLQEILAKGYSAEVIRLHILESHYRTQSNFSWDALEAAKNRLSDYRAMAALRWQAQPTTHDSGTFALEEVPTQLASLLAEDLDTPRALALLSEVATQQNAVLVETDMLQHFTAMLEGIDKLFGLSLSEVPDITNAQKKAIHDRDQARTADDWVTADRIRDELTQQGIGLRDSTNGTIWYPL